MVLTQEEAHRLFEYKDGALLFKHRLLSRNRPSTKAGQLATSTMSNGYLNLTANKKRYLAHRVVFLMHHGYVPQVIDHIDGNPSNNRIENLRPATVAQNAQNCLTRVDNTSGFKGIHFNRQKNKWQSKLNVRGKQIARAFDTKELAIEFMELFRELAHGNFANHGQHQGATA